MLLSALVACGQEKIIGLEPQTSTKTAWRDDFDTLDLDRWRKSTRSGFWQRNGISGNWNADNVYINQAGQLVLQMDTEACGKGFALKVQN